MMKTKKLLSLFSLLIVLVLSFEAKAFLIPVLGNDSLLTSGEIVDSTNNIGSDAEKNTQAAVEEAVSESKGKDWKVKLEKAKLKIEEAKKKVQDKINSVVDKVNEKVDAIKDKVEEKVEAIKEKVEEKIEKVKDKVEEKVSKVKDKVEEAKDKVEEKVDAVKDKVEDKVDAVKDKVEEKVEKVQDKVDTAKSTADRVSSTYDSVSGEVGATFEESKAAAEKVKSKTELVKKEQDLKNQMQSRKEVMLAEQTAKIAAAQENLNAYVDMYNAAQTDEERKSIAQEMESTQALIEQYQENLKQIQEGNEEFLQGDSEYAKLTTEHNAVVQDIASQAAGKAEELTNKLASSVKALCGGNSSGDTQMYDKFFKEYFLVDGQDQTPENVEKIMAKRREVFLSDIAYAYSLGASYRATSDESLQDSEDAQDDIKDVDTKLTAVNMLTAQKIDEISRLYQYLELKLASMRLKTSQFLVNQPYRLQSYDKDPAQLNFDNYVFTEEDFLRAGKPKSKTNAISGVKGMVNDAKSAADKVKGAGEK